VTSRIAVTAAASPPRGAGAAARVSLVLGKAGAA
jgi:hypothetical protein